MPYITDEAKEYIRMNKIPGRVSGELNYNITRLILDYMDFHGLCYQTINDIVGALESSKAEFQRRVVANYEDTKIKSNGDVYE